MKRLLFLLVLLLPLACAAPPLEVEDESVATLGMGFEDGPSSSGRFLGGIQDTFSDHVEDSMAGLDFFWRSVSRHTARDWAELSGVFR